MRIKELKELLDQYDENMEVKIFDSGSGNIDITEVCKMERVAHCALLQGMPHKVEYVCIV